MAPSVWHYPNKSDFMFENDITINRHQMRLFDKTVADLPEDTLFAPSPGHGHPAAWVMGHIGDRRGGAGPADAWRLECGEVGVRLRDVRSRVERCSRAGARPDEADAGRRRDRGVRRLAEVSGPARIPKRCVRRTP